VPNALLHNLKHNKVLHERIVLLTVHVQDVPHVPETERVAVERLGKGFFRVVASYGFLDQPDVPRALELCRSYALPIDPMLTTFFLARETLVPSSHPRMDQVAERVFMLLSEGNLPATAYFKIPPNQVVELGTQVEI
jgi:KUP system potassium uptake protein